MPRRLETAVAPGWGPHGQDFTQAGVSLCCFCILRVGGEWSEFPRLGLGEMTDTGLNLGGRGLLPSYHAFLCHPLTPGTTVPFSAVLCLFVAAAVSAFPVSPNPQSSTGSVFLGSKMNRSSWGKNCSLQVAVRKQKRGNLIWTKLI